MPSSSGVYSLPPGYLATTGTTILASQHNPIFEDAAAALTLRLSRDGSAPMTGPINLSAGSVTSPSLIFQGNVGSGLYPTTNGIGVGIGGVQVAEFLAGGLVGFEEKIKSIMQQYRDERGADESCTVGFTNDVRGFPSVKGRPCFTLH